MGGDRAYTAAENQLAGFLRVLGLVLVGLSVFTLIAPYIFRAAPLFVAPPFFVSNTIAGLALLSFLAWLAQADVRRYRAMIYVLIGGFLIGAAAFAGLAARPVNLMQDAPLVFGFLACAAVALAITVLTYRAKMPQAPWLPWIPDKPLSIWEKIARVGFGLFGIGSLFAAAASVVLPYLNVTLISSLLVNPFMIAGSTIKIAVLGLCALLVAIGVRRYTHYNQMITALIIGHAASFAAISLLWLFGFDRFGDYTLTIGGMTQTRDQMMFGAWALDIVLIAAFAFINQRINRVLLDYVGFLNSMQFRAMESIAETLVSGGEGEVVPPYQIVLRTDSYLKSFRSGRLRLAKLAIMGLQLSPLIWWKPPINYMHPAARHEFINRRFKEEIIEPTILYRVIDGIVRAANLLILRLRRRPTSEVGATLSFIGLLEAMMRFNMQLCYIGYYNNPAVWPKDENGSGIGYVPFSERPKDFPVVPRRPYPRLKVTTPEVIEREGIDTIYEPDVVIIGSGAAGSILAEQMLAKGRRVLMLERGQYVHPDDFTEDEIDMISRLYSDGALQISQALRFTILQGSCVGGTTVVNNAVCFDTPASVLECWNSRNSTPVIDVDAFYASQRAVRDRLHIGRIHAGTRQPLDGGVLNHGDGKVTAAVQKYFSSRANGYRYDVIDANILDCLGCGYCNIGCKYGRKLSMLDEVLPRAQHTYGPDNFQIVSEAEAVRLEESGGQITEIVARVRGKHKLYIKKPKTVIVAAGTIASSWLLMQSKIGRGRLPVGQGLSFNMGSPLHALFDEPVYSYDGLQIAHYLALDDHPGFVYETWFNPPVAQALAMPGWLDTHFHNMQMYDRMVAVGVLVGTEATSYIVPALITGGPDVVFQPSAKDLSTLVDALVILGSILLEGGAREVYASTRRYQSYQSQNGQNAVFTSQAAIEGLRDLVRQDYDILLGTGHPQGGNALGTSPTNSVVGSDFKVFGTKNLYLCDASIFPTATTVNPQLTVMSMAHYASNFIDA